MMQYDQQSKKIKLDTNLISSTSLRDNLTNILKKLDDLIPSSAGCSIILWNTETESFDSGASTVKNQPTGTVEREVRTEGGATRWIVDNKLPLNVPDTAYDPFGASTMIKDYEIQSYIGVPLIIDNGIIGVVYALSIEKNTYQETEMKLLESFVHFISISIQNAKMTTELYEAYQLINQGHNQLQAIFDTIPDNIFIKDLDGNFIKVNKEGTKYYGVDHHDAVIGKTNFDFFPRETAEDLKNDDLYVLETGNPIHNKELAIENSDGSIDWILNNKVALRNEDNKIVGIVGSSRRITDRKVAEQQYKLLESKEQYITILQKIIDNIGHDFKTPLSIIDTALFILKRKYPQILDRQVDSISTQSKRLLNMVDSMIETARLEQVKTLLLKSEDIITIAHNVIESYSELAKHKNQHLSLTYNEKPILYAISIDEFTQVLQNLISNALIHNPENTEISVNIEKKALEIQISIKDTGIGIPENELAHIFDHFYRVDTSRNSATGGTGLGLAIVQKIVDLHHGQIKVNSQLGVGTEFQISLPHPLD